MALLSGVNLLPSTGEFAYDTIAHRGKRAVETNQVPINTYFAPGGSRTDYSYAIDQLQATHPECTTVSLVIAWFGDSLDASVCRIYPSTTYIGGIFQTWTGAAWVNETWKCSSLTQASPGLIPITQTGDRFDYGGTPSDQSVVRCIQDLKARGFRVVFYPFILMDTAGFPWRGQITYSPDLSSAAANAVTHFLGSSAPANFTRDPVNLTVSYSGSPTDYSFRRMILHYANLCILAGGVDLFLLGSELRGLETIRGPAWTKPGTVDGGGNAIWDYSFVQGIVSLANDVRGIFDAAGKTKDLSGLHNLISYAADWSVWMGFQHPGADGQWPHLDQLYAQANIDLVCIDNYLPLSDWTTGKGGLDFVHWSDPKPTSWPPSPATMNGLGLSGTPTLLSKAYLKGNIEGGEKFNWFYFDGNNLGIGADPNGSDVLVSRPQADRLAQSRTQYYPSQELLANKQLRWWWNNTHRAIYDTGSGWVPQGPHTPWVARSKSVAFSEYGFASVDRAPNQPNVFFSATSSQSQTPFWSKWTPIGGPTFVPIEHDALMQLGLQALYEYWFVDGNNETAAGVPMLQQAFCSAWNWDARPFPVFPALNEVWGDDLNWRVGFWINGKKTFIPSADDSTMAISYPLTWPSDIRATRIDLAVATMSRSGGQSIIGSEQIVASPAARWEGKLTLPAMRAAQLLKWRGFIAALQGRLGTFAMPIFESGRQPFGPGATIAVSAAAAALNATSLTLTVVLGREILAGHRFSIAGRLYEIMQSTPGAPGVFVVDIHPWLRTAIGAATPCEFANPTCLMRLATDAEGRLDLESGIIAHPEINVVEAF